MDWDESTFSVIGIGVFVVFVVYPILMRAVLGIFSLTEAEAEVEEVEENDRTK